MNTYLTIMVTVLVATQIIRITQNHISLFRQEKADRKGCRMDKGQRCVGSRF